MFDSVFKGQFIGYVRRYGLLCRVVQSTGQFIGKAFAGSHTMSMQGSGSQGRDAANQTPWTEEQRTAIQEELSRILADPAFKSSKRCQAMLGRLVEYAVTGDHEGIKERTLGVEVFGRDPQYDTSADPIVRITANEIRKRLAQWYTEPGLQHPVRIRLIPGTYLPKFDFDPVPVVETAEEKAAAEALEQAVAAAKFSPRTGRLFALLFKRMRWGLVAIALIAILVSAYILIRRQEPEKREYLIWKPLLEQHNVLTMCAADVDLINVNPSEGKIGLESVAHVIASREAPRTGQQSMMLTNMSMIDSFAANKLGNLIGVYNRETVLRPASELSFDSFRHQPVVLIGGYNPWSLILLSKLRFSIRVDQTSQTMWIQDAQKPGNRDWSVTGRADHADVDYAIVSRFLDAETGQWIISLGGLWPYGTGSALSLLTDKEFAHLLPPAFYQEKNAQLVMKTAVINGNPGPPQIVAVHTW